MQFLCEVKEDIERYYTYCRKEYGEIGVNRIREELERIDKELCLVDVDTEPYIRNVGYILRVDVDDKIIFRLTLGALKEITPFEK
jgi:hypothetical protein